MAKYNREGGVDTGCLIVLKASGQYDGQPTIEELEEIDDVMEGVGSERTGKRVDVDTTFAENLASVSYAYQESLNHKDIEHAVERLELLTELTDPYITIKSNTFRFKQ